MIALTLDGVFYPSIAEAMRETNLSRYMINKILKLGEYKGHVAS